MSDKIVVTAKNAMTQNFIMFNGMQTVSDALKAMKAQNVDVLIINKRTQHDVYGILLLSDIAKKVLAKDKSPERVNIYEIMAKPVISVPPQMDVRYCARLFERFGLSYAPVIEAEEILGLISYKDLLLTYFSE
jgi:predicted transcriptional regulator